MEWDGCSECNACDDPDLKLHGKCGCHHCNRWQVTYVWTEDGRKVMLVEDRIYH